MSGNDSVHTLPAEIVLYIMHFLYVFDAHRFAMTHRRAWRLIGHERYLYMYLKPSEYDWWRPQMRRRLQEILKRLIVEKLPTYYSSRLCSTIKKGCLDLDLLGNEVDDIMNGHWPGYTLDEFATEYLERVECDAGPRKCAECYYYFSRSDTHNDRCLECW